MSTSSNLTRTVHHSSATLKQQTRSGWGLPSTTEGSMVARGRVHATYWRLVSVDNVNGSVPASALSSRSSRLHNKSSHTSQC